MRYRLRIDQLQALLAESRRSQNHWAIRLGFSRGHWSDIVNGKHPYPSARTRDRMVELLGVPFEMLFVPENVATSSPDVEFRAALSDRYLIERELGQGAMGVVYLARDLAHGRQVAVKQLSREVVSGIGINAFLREISVLARLQHPNILPLFATGAAADHPFFVMPWVREGSLRDRLAREVRLPLGRVQRIVGGIASALSYAHAEHVLHCDVKPENILLHGDHAWLTDFGISRILHAEASEWRAQTRIDISAGTPAYVSPEQADGATLDGRTDVYSLGCVTYEMLAGRPPFEGETTEIVVAKRFISTPPPIRSFAPEISPAVTGVVAQAMEVRRDARLPNPLALSDALDAAAGSQSPIGRVAARGSRLITRTAGTVRKTMGKRPAFGFARGFGLYFADVRSAWRQARSAPVLTLVTTATLAIAIALATATYTLVDNVLLRPLPFAQPERLVSLRSVDSTGADFSVVSLANWLDWRSAPSIEATAIYMDRRVSLRDGVAATRVPGVVASGDFFRVVRPRFAIGRGPTGTEAESATPVAVVSERLWRSLLGADSSLRAPLHAIAGDLKVVGVVAEGDEFPAGADLWMTMLTPTPLPNTRDYVNYYSVARLRSGASIAQVKAELARISASIRERDPASRYTYGVGVQSLQQEIVGDAGGYLRLLLGAVAFVLLVACANVAAANIGRGTARAREFAVRAALGAARGRLFSQLLTEHVTTACVGGLLGIALSWAAVRAVVGGYSEQIPRAAEISLDTRVLAVATIVTMFAGVLAGILPALLASSAPAEGLTNSGSRSATRGGRNIPGALLVVVQIAIALVLVCGTSLMLRSFQSLLAHDLGFDTNVATVEATLSPPAYRNDRARQMRYWAELRARLRAIPGVDRVGVATWTPLSIGGNGFLEIDGKKLPDATANYRVVSDDYLEALDVKLVAGRALTANDDASSEPVALISAETARRYFKGENPIGQRVREPQMENVNANPVPWRTIVGVVNAVRHFGFESEPSSEIYVPFRQVGEYWTRGMTAVVSGSVPVARLLPEITAAARGVDRDVAVDISTMSARARNNTATKRMIVTVMSVFGFVALMLAALGTYGLLSYAVAQRGRELAIRSALGATRAQLIRMVFGGVGRIVVAGLAAGVALALALTRLIESQLVDVAPTDAAAFGASIAAIVVAAAMATWVPARRAGRADPSEALRGE